MPQWFLSVGIMSWPLLVLSVLGLTLVFDRIWVFSLACYQYFQLKKSNGPLYTWLQSHHLATPQLRDDGAMLWLNRWQNKLKQRLALLSVIASLAPLMGLLGTVWGLILMFQKIAQTQAAVTPALLADGLWEAMYSTMAGLFVAIPALFIAQCFNGFNQQLVDAFILRINELNFSLNHPEVEYVKT